MPGEFEGRGGQLCPLTTAPEGSEGSSQMEKNGVIQGATGDLGRAWWGHSATVFSLQTQNTLPPPPLSTAITSMGGQLSQTLRGNTKTTSCQGHSILFLKRPENLLFL